MPGPAVLRALQRTAGNAAVAQVVQRLAKGGGPVAPVPVTPTSDPRFRAVTAQVRARSAALKKHPAPAAEAKKAQQAAVPPAADKEAQAKAAQAEQMVAAQPIGFDKAGFIAAVRAAIAAKAPKDLDEADRFADSGKAEQVKAEVSAKVAAGKEASARQIVTATSASPDPSRAVDKPVTPLAAEPAPGVLAVDGAAAVPRPAPAEQTDLSSAKRETDAAMADADVTEEQLARSNEPELQGALAAKRAGEQHAASAPAVVRAQERDVLTAARAGATAAGGQGLLGMLDGKRSAIAGTAAGKQAAKAKDEAARAQVTNQVKAVFDTTKKDVEGVLSALDGLVAQTFEAGEKAARDAFTADHKARMQRYKDERYSGPAGAGRWLRDKFAGLPEEAGQVFVRAKALYESRMDRVISDVADVVAAQLGRAKERIARGRAEVKELVARQPKELQRVAGEAAQSFAQQFDQLEQEVDDKGQALVDDLASRYVDARSAVDEQVKAMQEEHKGLWDRAKDAVGGAVRTVLQLKDMLTGVLARAAGAVSRIIKDPIGFLGNLVNAVKAGVLGFAERVGEHLKKGLQGWLLGALAGAGVELPERFDAKGVVQLVLSLLGLTWASIRARIVKKIPERVMGAVERGVGFIQVVLNEGVGGLWRWVVEKLGDLRARVMEQIRDFVITRIVRAGITWLVSLLNPAAAFIKACKTIYDVVMFFVEKASHLKELADAVLDAVETVAGGGAGGVAGKIEQTLSKMVPVLLGFLASLLGLGGISDRIRAILETVQKPVGKVIDGLVGVAVTYGKKLLDGLRRRGGRAGPDETPQAKQKRLDDGLTAAQSAVDRLPGRAIGAAVARPVLAAVKLRYRMTSLTLVPDGDRWAVAGEVNPRGRRSTSKSAEKDSTAQATLTVKAARTTRGLRASGLDPLAPPPGVAVLSQSDRDDLARRWTERADEARTPRERAQMLKRARDAKAGRLPESGLVSEQEVAWLHDGTSARSQVSYLSNRAVEGMPRGSTRPDLQVASWNVETKRYILRRQDGQGRRELIAELRRQYAARLEHLPAHLQLQAIVVDVRGQYLTPAEIQALRGEIHAEVVQACYREAQASQKWWVSPSSRPPGPESVTVLAGDVG